MKDESTRRKLPLVATMIGALVAGGLGLNAYLLLQHRSRSDSSAVTQGSPFIVHEAGAGASAPELVPMVAAPGGSMPSFDSCAVKLEACQSALMATKTEAEKNLPPGERFKRGKRMPEAEASLAPLVKKAFGANPPAYTLECRGGECQLDMLWKDGQEDDKAMQAFQTEETSRLFRSSMFSGSTPTRDAVTGETHHKQQFIFELQPPGTESGIDHLRKVVDVFKASGAKEACFAAFGGEGQIPVALRIGDETGGKVLIEHGGGLANADSGKCLLQRLRLAADQTPIEKPATGAVFNLTIVMPPTTTTATSPGRN